ncbi:hypothetical protein [Nocardia sp. NBC_01388]|uniref:hypothetical protein n=1 Tax=Nocardia sp. NBC_01388 TaxID=2903596 RepID=UPI00325699A0
MSIRMCAAAALAGAVVSVAGGAVASAGPATDGLTSCGAFSADLQRAQEDQGANALALSGYRTWYAQLQRDPSYTSNDLAYFYQDVQRVTTNYNQSKRNTAGARAAAETALCSAH